MSTGSPSGFHEASNECLLVAVGTSSKADSTGGLAASSNIVSNVDFGPTSSIKVENLVSEVSSTEFDNSSSTRFCFRDSKVGRVGR